MKAVFRSHEFSSYTFHYSRLLKWSHYPEEKAIYSTEHQKQKKRSCFESSDQTLTPASPTCKQRLGWQRHQESIQQWAGRVTLMHQAPQGEPADLPTGFCSLTVVVVGTVGTSWVFRLGTPLWGEVILFSQIQVGKGVFSAGGNDKEAGNTMIWNLNLLQGAERT